MSDILIRGMEMPEHCGECKLKAEYDDETFCPFFADNVEYWIAAGRRHEECPLVNVPPHGDLIDLRSVNLEDGTYEYQDWVECALEQYLNAQHFILASE